MKKEVLILCFALVLIFPIISAIDIQMPSDVPEGQTVIAKFPSGNFLDSISKENVEFYREHVRTNFDYDIAKIGDYYYVYFQTLDKDPLNYSIVITGVRYYVGAQVSNEDIEKNFSINSQTADFKVNPGFIVTNGNFSLEVQNLQPSTLTININTEINSGSSNGFFSFLFKNNEVQEDSQNEKSIDVLSGNTEEIDIILEDITETTIRTITLSSENSNYEIPVYVILQSSSDPEENETSQDETNETITEDNETSQDTGENETITEENETSRDENNETITEDNETSEDNETEEDSGSFWDDLFGRDKKDTKEENQTTNDTEPDYQEGKENNSLQTCDQREGTICVAGEEVCEGTPVQASDTGSCCIGQCVQKETSNTGKIIGWSIIGLIVILLIWFKQKFKKTTKRKVNLPGIDKKIK